jgi:hypothetical protein
MLINKKKECYNLLIEPGEYATQLQILEEKSKYFRPGDNFHN